MSELETELRALEQSKQGSYDKRTEHLDADGRGLFINRLIREDSPYLLQHAHNPVNWYPWGEEAFEHAREQNKPVFLSIGYSTCHWCHVMEVESFDNVEVAEVLNAGFISIKMDREQYPDIDEVYMTGVQLVSGQGGWPMSSFLLGDGKPFFGATYFPAQSFIALLEQISTAWHSKYAELESSAGQIAEAIDRILSDRKQAASLQSDIVAATVEALSQREDRSYGGLSGEPKFPQEPLLLLLLDHVRRERDSNALGFVDRALEGMARGGIFDQVGGGFHRYSVDAQWLVPHFEKMLYNQSQLALCYLQAFELTGKPFFRRICEQTLDYVARDMQLADGGFYSATDADSEGSEGTFFTWTLSELEAVLNKNELDLVKKLYAPSEFGNFEESNILMLSKSLEEFAADSGSESFYTDLDAVLEKLYHAREERVHPLRDDKLIVAWAAAMMTAFVDASRVLSRPDYLATAQKAAAFVWEHNVDDEGVLQRIYLEGTVSILGQLEDYVNFAEALINLFDATDEKLYLERADALMTVALSEFWDTEHGGFFLSPAQQSGPQLTRSRNGSDGAILSPVATAYTCLLRLQRRAAQLGPESVERERVLGERLDAGIAEMIAHINDNPLSHPSMLRLLAERDAGSLSPSQWLSGGRVRIDCRRLDSSSDEERHIEIAIRVLEGWHLTAPGQGGDSFHPLNVSLAESEQYWQLASCDYPAAHSELEVEAAGKVAIFEGSLKLKAVLQPGATPADLLSAASRVQITLQLCSESSCQLPLTVNLCV